MQRPSGDAFIPTRCIKKYQVIIYRGLSGRKSFGEQLRAAAIELRWLRLYFARDFVLSTSPIKPMDKSVNADSSLWEMPFAFLISLTLSITNCSIAEVSAFFTLPAIRQHSKKLLQKFCSYLYEYYFYVDFPTSSSS